MTTRRSDRSKTGACRQPSRPAGTEPRHGVVAVISSSLPCRLTGPRLVVVVGSLLGQVAEVSPILRDPPPHDLLPSGLPADPSPGRRSSSSRTPLELSPSNRGPQCRRARVSRRPDGLLQVAAHPAQIHVAVGTRWEPGRTSGRRANAGGRVCRAGPPSRRAAGARSAAATPSARAARSSGSTLAAPARPGRVQAHLEQAHRLAASRSWRRVERREQLRAGRPTRRRRPTPPPRPPCCSAARPRSATSVRGPAHSAALATASWCRFSPTWGRRGRRAAGGRRPGRTWSRRRGSLRRGPPSAQAEAIRPAPHQGRTRSPTGAASRGPPPDQARRDGRGGAVTAVGEQVESTRGCSGDDVDNSTRAAASWAARRRRGRGPVCPSVVSTRPRERRR